MMTPLRITTRKSPLALWQAYYVRDALKAHYPELPIEILPLMTEGDRRLETPLTLIGGKGLFVKELDSALLRHEADIAVHSIKDIPFPIAESLVLAAVCEREDPRDVVVSNQYTALSGLPQGAVIGTSSPRRTCLLHALHPDIIVQSLRGNVGTRLEKLDAGEFDALILAAAGIKRLGVTHRITEFLAVTDWVPAPGQGAVGVVCRENDPAVLRYLAVLDHPETRACVTAERAVSEALEGGCQLPLGVHAMCQGEVLALHGVVGRVDGLIREQLVGRLAQASELGAALAQRLRGSGGD